MEGSGSALTISGGTIQGFTASTSGGGVYMRDGTFNMTGGAIENCTASEGAGVKMYPDSGNTCTFTMSDSAEIKNCSNDGVSIALEWNVQVHNEWRNHRQQQRIWFMDFRS